MQSRKTVRTPVAYPREKYTRYANRISTTRKTNDGRHLHTIILEFTTVASLTQSPDPIMNHSAAFFWISPPRRQRQLRIPRCHRDTASKRSHSPPGRDHQGPPAPSSHSDHASWFHSRPNHFRGQLARPLDSRDF